MSLLIRIVLVLSLLLFSACMKMGPDYERPVLNMAVPEAFQHAAHGRSSVYTEMDRWWQAFDDPEIGRIVMNVIQNNPDIQTAAARVLEAQAVFKQTRADQYPTLNLGAEAGRQRQTFTNPLTGAAVSTMSDGYTLSVPASFELDLWGRLARSTEAAKAELLAAEENRRTVIQTLVAEAVNLYLKIESLERQIQVNQKSVEAYRQSQEVVEERYRRGLTTILDVRQASRMLARAESQLPALTAALGTSRQSLAILRGKYPKSEPSRRQTADYFKMPSPVPPGLPSDLIARRPDIRATEAKLHSACAQIGAAKAYRFPQIKLTGTFGYASDELSTLIEPESELWSIAAGGMQPVFNAGKLAAGQRAAEARYEQALSTYAKTVLQAFAEVEGALLNRKEHIERRRRLLKYLDEAVATLDVAQDRYTRGLVDYLTILDSQQVRYEAEQQLIEVEYEILSNRISLCRALGGGWDLTIDKIGPLPSAPHAESDQNLQKTL